MEIFRVAGTNHQYSADSFGMDFVRLLTNERQCILWLLSKHSSWDAV